MRIVVVGVTDHPADYAAGPDRPGVAYADLEAVPLALDYCFTRLADADEAHWITARFRRACAALGTEVTEHEGRLVIEWNSAMPHPEPRDTTPTG